jgi:hypothetical protein
MKSTRCWSALVLILALLLAGCGDGGSGGGQMVSPSDPSSANARQTSYDNVRSIVRAMQGYHDTFGSFPAAVVIGPDGQTPHSWRVALLPFLEHRSLYDQYRQDEPWDGPNNSKLLAQMPDVYRSPFDPPDSTNAAYYVLSGPGAVFEGEKAMRVGDAKDGLANTLCVVESKRDVPWTKPEDIPYDPQQPLPKLGGYYEGAFFIGKADGAAVFLDASIGEAQFRALVSCAGREPLEPLPQVPWSR